MLGLEKAKLNYQKSMSNPLYTTLAAPKKHKDIPSKARWLGGEGAGSWFEIVLFNEDAKEDNKLKSLYLITRFAPNSTIECKGIFTCNANFEVEKNYDLSYLSHCAEVNVKQENKNIKFQLKEKH